MKVLQIIIIGIVLFLAVEVKAQVAVNVNIGSPPPWGPAGYTEMCYYYLPDVESFYEIQSSRFIYRIGGEWVHSTYLPRQYRSYNLYDGYKVVMTDYRGKLLTFTFLSTKLNMRKATILVKRKKPLKKSRDKETPEQKCTLMIT
jgi:hypothetical protein